MLIVCIVLNFWFTSQLVLLFYVIKQSLLTHKTRTHFFIWYYFNVLMFVYVSCNKEEGRLATAIYIAKAIENRNGRKRIKCFERTRKEQLRAANFHSFYICL